LPFVPAFDGATGLEGIAGFGPESGTGLCDPNGLLSVTQGLVGFFVAMSLSFRESRRRDHTAAIDTHFVPLRVEHASPRGGAVDWFGRAGGDHASGQLERQGGPLACAKCSHLSAAGDRGTVLDDTLHRFIVSGDAG